MSSDKSPAIELSRGETQPEPQTAQTVGVSADPGKRVTPDELLSLRRTEAKIYVFDLRDPESFLGGHLPGAFNLPFEYLADSLWRMPFDGTILFYDGGEGQAAQAAAMLADNGYDQQFYLAEGIDTLLKAMENSPHEIHFNKLSGPERVAAIEKVLDDKVRAFLAKDGGGLEVKSVEEERVLVSYQGACTSCGSSTQGTLRFIENTLSVSLNHPIEVIPVE
ncbi:MAG: NifU family protein [Deltaproteobacteria bacterium]|nr:NifU family protein [Deltaproteobacteria bacterium]